MAARKPIAELIEELKSWLPNYDHGPADYPTLLWRVLASLPGGDQAEDMGYEPFQLGWQELDQLGRVLVAIQDKQDVEDLVAGLIGGEYEVIVGNVGTVYSGTNEEEARHTYDEYVKQSKSGRGRAAGESVTLMLNGEPIKEHEGETEVEETGRHRPHKGAMRPLPPGRPGGSPVRPLPPGRPERSQVRPLPAGRPRTVPTRPAPPQRRRGR